MNKFSLFIFGLLSVFIAGCGSISSGANVTYAPAYLAKIANGQPVATDSNTTGSVPGTPSQSSKDYNCPSTPNVFPQYAANYAGVGEYTVCPSNNSSDLSDILVHGTVSNNSDWICVFPVAQTSQGSRWVSDPNTGAPMYQCTRPTSDGAFFSFSKIPSGIQFNAVKIVETTNATTDVLAEQLCLETRGSNCPNDSYGRFR